MEELPGIVGMGGFGDFLERPVEFDVEMWARLASSLVIVSVPGLPKQPVVVNQKAIVNASRW